MNGRSRHPYLTSVLQDSVQLLMWACVGSGFPQLSFIPIPSWTNVGFCLMLFLLLWIVWNFPIFSVNMLNVISWFSNINLTLNLGLRISLYICQDPYGYGGELSSFFTVLDLGRNVNTHFKMNLEVSSSLCSCSVCTFCLFPRIFEVMDQWNLWFC